MQYGAASGSLATVETLTWWFCTIFGVLTGGGLIAEHIGNKQLNSKMLARQNKLSLLAKRYNDVTALLEEQYHMEKRGMTFLGSQQKELLRERYENLYLKNRQGYEQERQRLLALEEKGDAPTTRLFKRFWKGLIVVGLLSHIAACSYTLGTADKLEEEGRPLQQKRVATTGNTRETVLWTAETVPMPHLTDGNRYVSNPDKVVSENTVSLLDRMLKRMDDSLQIESSMIIVNHVENKDVFRLAQDIFDRYHVGKNDRGLVIVLAYADHQVRTHTGRALEADLTDIECSRLQQRYAIPFMKSEQPDSGMLYLTEAIYNTLKKKDLPLTASQKWEAEAEKAADYSVFYIFIFGLWALLIVYLNHRYNGTSGRNLLRANPFAKAAPVMFIGGGGFGGGRGGGFGGGFGGGGGGFSGGSSGGGGATSSW